MPRTAWCAAAGLSKDSALQPKRFTCGCLSAGQNMLRRMTPNTDCLEFSPLGGLPAHAASDAVEHCNTAATCQVHPEANAARICRATASWCPPAAVNRARRPTHSGPTLCAACLQNLKVAVVNYKQCLAHLVVRRRARQPRRRGRSQYAARPGIRGPPPPTPPTPAAPRPAVPLLSRSAVRDNVIQKYIHGLPTPPIPAAPCPSALPLRRPAELNVSAFWMASLLHVTHQLLPFPLCSRRVGLRHWIQKLRSFSTSKHLSYANIATAVCPGDISKAWCGFAPGALVCVVHTSSKVLTGDSGGAARVCTPSAMVCCAERRPRDRSLSACRSVRCSCSNSPSLAPSLQATNNRGDASLLDLRSAIVGWWTGRYTRRALAPTFERWRRISLKGYPLTRRRELAAATVPARQGRPPALLPPHISPPAAANLQGRSGPMLLPRCWQ